MASPITSLPGATKVNEFWILPNKYSTLAWIAVVEKFGFFAPPLILVLSIHRQRRPLEEGPQPRRGTPECRGSSSNIRRPRPVLSECLCI